MYLLVPERPGAKRRDQAVNAPLVRTGYFASFHLVLGKVWCGQMAKVNAGRRHILQIDKPDPSWTPIRAAPFIYQAEFIRGSTSLLPGPARLSEAVIDAVVVDSVKDPLVECSVARDTFQFALTSTRFEWSDGIPEFTCVSPFEVRQQYMASDGVLVPGSENFVAQIEALWALMENRFRRAHSNRHCEIVARVGLPRAPRFTELSANVFAEYRIVDWNKGIAELAGDRLYDLHAVPPIRRPNAVTFDDVQALSLLLRNSTVGSQTERSLARRYVGNEPDLASELAEAKRLVETSSERRLEIARILYWDPSINTAEEKVRKSFLRKIENKLRPDGRLIDSRTAKEARVLVRSLRKLKLTDEELRSVGFAKDGN